MSSKKPPIHGRDHLPGGADPIPVTSTLTTYQQHILDGMPDEGAYWPLDDTDVTLLKDIGPNAKNGVYVNNPTLQIAPLIGDGKAVAFHGGSSTYGKILTDQHGIVGPDGSWTVGCWIETTQTVGHAGADSGSYAQVVCSDDNARRYFQFRLVIASGVMEVICFASGGTSYSKVGSVVVNDGIRHLVAARYDAGANELTLWIDSVQDGAAVTGPASPSLLVPHMLIGARKPNAFYGSFFDGTIDEVFLYGDAADDTFMSGLYVLGFDTTITGSKWYFGSGVPPDSLGNNGDFYQNTDNGDIYQKEGGSWGSPIANSTVINPGDITGTELEDFGDGAETVGDSTHYPIVTVDAKGRVSHMVAQAVSGGSPSGAAGGALDGTYPNPGIAASVAGAGLAESSDVLSVNVDGTTIEINSDTLRLKDTGPGATGPIGDGTHVAAVTINAKGQVTGLTSTAITFPGATDIAVTAAPGSDDTASGVKIDLTAGESLAMGDPVYIKSDGKVWKADADTAGTFPAIGLATTTAAANATVTVLLLGIARHDAWAWTVGGIVYLSTSSGLTQAQPSATDNAIQIIGIAPHADRLYVNPQLVWITHT